MKHIVYLLSPLFALWLVVWGASSATPMPTTLAATDALKPSPTLVLAEPTRKQALTPSATPSPVGVGDDSQDEGDESAEIKAIIRKQLTKTPALARHTPTPTAPYSLVNRAPMISLAVDPHDAQTIIAIQSDELLIKSHDGGQTWRPLARSMTLSRLSYQRLYAPPRRSWPPSFLLSQQAVQAVPNRAGQFLLRADGMLWRTNDGGSSWQAIQKEVRAWTMADATGDLLYTWPFNLPHARHGLYRTKNGGTTWRRVYRGFFPPLFQNQLYPPNHEGITALLAAEPRVLYAGTDLGIFRSVDGGVHWQEFHPGLPPTKRAYRWTPVLIAAADGTIFAVTEYAPNVMSSRTIIARLRPGEESWTTVGEDALANFQGDGSFGDFNILVADPIEPNRLYLGTDVGLLLTHDGGESWRMILEGMAVYRMAIAPSKPSQLYLWTDEGFVAYWAGSSNTKDIEHGLL